MKTVTAEAEKNRNIFFVTGDLGYSVIEDFRERFPDQFLNVGVAEQNMIGVAAGIASTGKTVFAYSIGNFSTLRCLEQIRNDVCYHNLNVKIVSVGTGFHYGALASTHHATEDMAIMRALPNMTIVAPGDPIEAELATLEIIRTQGPCYLRLCQEQQIHSERPQSFSLGKGIRIRDGNDIAILSIGGMLHTALETAKLLDQRAIYATVISMHTLKPIDRELIISTAKKIKYIVTIEEHTLSGGFGSAVAEVLMEHHTPHVKLQRVGIPNCFPQKYGGRNFLRELHGLSPQQIADSITNRFQHPQPYDSPISARSNG